MSYNKFGYKGFANKETWMVQLWLHNDEGYHDGAIEAMSNATDSSKYRRKEQLHNFVEEVVARGDIQGLALDLITSALADVNWYEVLDTFEFEDDELEDATDLEEKLDILLDRAEAAL